VNRFHNDRITPIKSEIKRYSLIMGVSFQPGCNMGKALAIRVATSIREESMLSIGSSIMAVLRPAPPNLLLHDP